MQHNDIGPGYHPTDVGHVKLASHLIQYIKLKFDWVLYSTGPEVQHDTLYVSTFLESLPSFTRHIRCYDTLTHAWAVACDFELHLSR